MWRIIRPTVKHNPTEHCVFCCVTRACEGVMFDSTHVKQLMERTQTQAGLSVTVDIVYEPGRKACEHLKSVTKIAWDSILSKWNYALSPALIE